MGSFLTDKYEISLGRIELQMVIPLRVGCGRTPVGSDG